MNDEKRYIPPTRKKKLYFKDDQEAIDKYNELLFDKYTHSIYKDPVTKIDPDTGKEVIIPHNWCIELEVFTEEYMKKYGNKCR
jgi:hypothetical protein